MVERVLGTRARLVGFCSSVQWDEELVQDQL